MTSHTIYTSTNETRTFTVGETFDFFVGEVAHEATVIGFPGGVFELTLADGEPFLILGGVLAKALKAHRRPIEQLVKGW